MFVLMNNAIINIPEERVVHYRILYRLFRLFGLFKIVICIRAVSIVEIL